jgi:hypothetical protein
MEIHMHLHVLGHKCFQSEKLNTCETYFEYQVMFLCLQVCNVVYEQLQKLDYNC